MIDTHCHIDEEAFQTDREEVIARQQEAGVEAIIVPGVSIDSIATVMEVCHQHPNLLYPALGLHPEEVKADWQEQLQQMKEAIYRHQEELVAIGEIGLDYYWDTTFREEQKEVFRTQLGWAQDLQLPVIIHNRESTEDILRILREFCLPTGSCYIPGRPLRGVFHCFTGSAEVARELLKMGFWLGIGGVLTFKNCHLAETLRQVPLERLLLETDSPYLTPVPHRGERNESRYIQLVAARLAEVYGCSKEEIIRQTSEQAEALFHLKNRKK